MGRLLLVANRLPVTLDASGGEVLLRPSHGGLATGLRGPHRASDGLWIGSLGDAPKLHGERARQLAARLKEERLVSVNVRPTDYARYYAGFSNGVLWPLFHYLLERIPEDTRDWESYRRANEVFAKVVESHYRAGDTIWVHDYQLTLLPALLRRALPDATIGFFLHIPFPASDVFRTLPWRAEVLEGMLGADLVGFHDFSYLRYFAKSAARILGADFGLDYVKYDKRTTRLGVFPMGVDAAEFAARAEHPDVLEQAARIRREAEDQSILVSIDRLDYTKGLRKKFQAFARLLDQNPQRRGKVRLIQVAVPTRTDVREYAKFRREVDEAVGRINGLYGTLGRAPIHYMYRSVSEVELAGLYRAADVMLVTPLRDGMNLVAKEFVATRTDGDGVLVLSEFAGAASELGEALVVNPFDVGGLAAAMERGLTMAAEERALRMRALRRRVAAHDVHRWARSFLDALKEVQHRPPASESRTLSARDAAELAEKIRHRTSVHWILDCDGPLAPPNPRDAEEPAPEVHAILAALADTPGWSVSIVSARPREVLDPWFGDLPVALYAEHGYWSRESGECGWRPARELDTTWKAALRRVLDDFTHRTPGSRVEETSHSMSWHYRGADGDVAELQARELTLHLEDMLSNSPVRVVRNGVERVVVVRQLGVDKGRVLEHLRNGEGDCLVVGVAGEASGEELLAAMPAASISIHVGRKPTRAMHRLRDEAELLAFLRQVVQAASSGPHASARPTTRIGA